MLGKVPYLEALGILLRVQRVTRADLQRAEFPFDLADNRYLEQTPGA